MGNTGNRREAEIMAYEMTREEEKCWQRERDLTRIAFMEREMENRNVYFTPEYRRDLEKILAEMKERYREYL